jgi:hypothetical protein
MNKEQYRKNREAGKRGQGEKINIFVGYRQPQDVKEGHYGTRKERRLKEAHHSDKSRTI